MESSGFEICALKSHRYIVALAHIRAAASVVVCSDSLVARGAGCCFAFLS